MLLLCVKWGTGGARVLTRRKYGGCPVGDELNPRAVGGLPLNAQLIVHSIQNLTSIQFTTRCPFNSPPTCALNSQTRVYPIHNSVCIE